VGEASNRRNVARGERQAAGLSRTAPNRQVHARGEVNGHTTNPRGRSLAESGAQRLQPAAAASFRQSTSAKDPLVDGVQFDLKSFNQTRPYELQRANGRSELFKLEAVALRMRDTPIDLPGAARVGGETVGTLSAPARRP